MRPTDIPVTTGSVRRTSLEAVGLRVTHLSFPPLLRLPTHTHTHNCLSVVLEGSLERSFARQRCRLRTSSVQTVPADAPHEEHVDDSGARTVIVEADAEATGWLSEYGTKLDTMRCFRDPGIGGLAARVARELDDPDVVSFLAVEGLVLELLALLARRGSVGAGAGRSPAWLENAREYLHAHFADAFDLGEVAAAAGVHPAHLARVFRLHHGITIGAYVRRLRLDWAADRLAGSDEPLASIAYAAGFANQSHFTRAFKSHTGLTPARYRLSSAR